MEPPPMVRPPFLSDARDVKDFNDNVGPSFLGVSNDSFPITASENVDLLYPVRALRVSGAGNVDVTTASGNRRIMAFAEGETRYVAVTKVWVEGTTATGIEGMP